MSFSVSVHWDEAGLKRADRFLGTYQGRELQKRIDKAFGKEIKGLVGKLRVAESGSGIRNRTGAHFRSIKLRKSRKRPGEVVAYTVGPSDRKRHLLVRGHRIVTQRGRDTGRVSRAFPYVEPVINAEAPEIMGRVGSEVWAQGVR